MDKAIVPAPLYTLFHAYADSPAALAVSFLWGLAEATLFFIIPDVGFGLIVLFNWRRGLLATVFVLAGALIGGTMMYLLGANNPAGMNQVLDAVPLIDMEMINLARSQLQTDGFWMMVVGAKEGIPYKVFAVESGILGLGLLEFILMTIPARMWRFLVVVLVEATIVTVLRQFVQKHPSLVVGIYVVFWICVYIGYYFRFR